MLTDSDRLSIAILRDVLDGATYESVAIRHGITRTAVEHRIKRLIKLIIVHVGIDGLAPHAAGYVRKLRERRNDVIAALNSFEDGQRRAVPPLLLTDSDIQSIFTRLAARGFSEGSRDAALVHVAFATGARPLEVARLEIRDYLLPNGEVRKLSVMRAEASVNRVERPLFFQSAGAVAAIDRYLETRRSMHHTASNSIFRGYSPEDRLFLNDRGQPFDVTEIVIDGKRQHLCRQILDTYRRIFRRVGIDGLSPTVIRKNVAIRLYGRRADCKQIGEILGISDLQSIKRWLPPKLSLDQLMKELFRP